MEVEEATNEVKHLLRLKKMEEKGTMRGRRRG